MFIVFMKGLRKGFIFLFCLFVGIKCAIYFIYVFLLSFIMQ